MISRDMRPTLQRQQDCWSTDRASCLGRGIACSVCVLVCELLHHICLCCCAYMQLWDCLQCCVLVCELLHRLCLCLCCCACMHFDIKAGSQVVCTDQFALVRLDGCQETSCPAAAEHPAAWLQPGYKLPTPRPASYRSLWQTALGAGPQYPGWDPIRIPVPETSPRIRQTALGAGPPVPGVGSDPNTIAETSLASLSQPSYTLFQIRAFSTLTPAAFSSGHPARKAEHCPA